MLDHGVPATGLARYDTSAGLLENQAGQLRVFDVRRIKRQGDRRGQVAQLWGGALQCALGVELPVGDG